MVPVKRGGNLQATQPIRYTPLLRMRATSVAYAPLRQPHLRAAAELGHRGDAVDNSVFRVRPNRERHARGVEDRAATVREGDAVVADARVGNLRSQCVLWLPSEDDLDRRVAHSRRHRDVFTLRAVLATSLAGRARVAASQCPVEEVIDGRRERVVIVARRDEQVFLDVEVGRQRGADTVIKKYPSKAP